MRYLSLLLLSIVISSFVLGAAEGLCPRLRYVDTTEWLDAEDLGFDLSMPDPNGDEPEELKAAEPEEKYTEKDDYQNATVDNGVEDGGVAEETANESGFGDRLDLTLVGDVTGKIDIALFRSGDVVFGTGTLTSGGAKSQVGASGSASKDALSLNLVPEDGSRIYVLDLDIKEGSYQGRYEAYNLDGQFFSGMADSTLFA